VIAELPRLFLCHKDLAPPQPIAVLVTNFCALWDVRCSKTAQRALRVLRAVVFSSPRLPSLRLRCLCLSAAFYRAVFVFNVSKTATAPPPQLVPPSLAPRTTPPPRKVYPSNDTPPPAQFLDILKKSGCLPNAPITEEEYQRVQKLRKDAQAKGRK